MIGVCSDEGRRQILQIHTRKMKLSPDIDFDSIVRDTQGYVGADIAQLCHEAAMQVITCSFNMTCMQINKKSCRLSKKSINYKICTCFYFFLKRLPGFFVRG